VQTPIQSCRYQQSPSMLFIKGDHCVGDCIISCLSPLSKIHFLRIHVLKIKTVKALFLIYTRNILKSIGGKVLFSSEL